MFYAYALSAEQQAGPGPTAPFTPSWRPCAGDAQAPAPDMSAPIFPLLLMPVAPPPPITPLFMNTAKISFV